MYELLTEPTPTDDEFPLPAPNTLPDSTFDTVWFVWESLPIVACPPMYTYESPYRIPGYCPLSEPITPFEPPNTAYPTVPPVTCIIRFPYVLEAPAPPTIIDGVPPLT